MFLKETEDVSCFFSKLLVVETKRDSSRQFILKSKSKINMKQSGQQAYRKLDVFLCLFFIFFWIIPQAYTNFTASKVPIFPKFITAIHSTSKLFTQANYVWPMPYIQIQLTEDSQWVDVDEGMFFQMPTFGYRTRLFEALYLATSDSNKILPVQKELAYWIAQKYKSIYPSKSIGYVRFVAGLNRAELNKKFEGRWANSPLDSFSQKDIYEISRHKIEH